MATLNRAGMAYARSLISDGSVNKSAAWSFSADDGNKLLGADGDDWSNYGKHFLGADASADGKTKDHWKYPFAKGMTLYRSALTAIRQRAGQQDDTAIFDAAGKLLDMIDKGKSAYPVEHKELTFDLKADAGDEGTFTGYGSIFGNLDSGGDVVQAGAFSESLNAWRSKGKWPRFLWQHDTRQPIGVWTNMQEDAKGLLVTGRFTKGVQAADEAYALLKDGALDGLSIGYRTLIDSFDTQNQVRTLEKVDLLEVSLVTIPMNEQASVTSVKAADRIRTIREFEAFLRDEGGFSRDSAKSIAAGGFKSQTSEPRDEAGMGDAIAALKRLEATLRG